MPDQDAELISKLRSYNRSLVNENHRLQFEEGILENRIENLKQEMRYKIFSFHELIFWQILTAIATALAFVGADIYYGSIKW